MPGEGSGCGLQRYPAVKRRRSVQRELIMQIRGQEEWSKPVSYPGPNPSISPSGARGFNVAADSFLIIIKKSSLQEFRHFVLRVSSPKPPHSRFRSVLCCSANRDRNDNRIFSGRTMRIYLNRSDAGELLQLGLQRLPRTGARAVSPFFSERPDRVVLDVIYGFQ